MSLNIGVFCGSRKGDNNEYANLVKRLSNWIGKNKYNIVYGGTNTGLMKILVKEASKYDIKIFGIVPEYLSTSIGEKQLSTDLILTKNLEKRKNQFIERSDCFIALPGGIGTLNEIFDFIVKKELKETNKKIFLINDNNFWDPLLKLISHIVNNGFLNKNVFKSLIHISSLEDCFKKIKDIKE